MKLLHLKAQEGGKEKDLVAALKINIKPGTLGGFFPMMHRSLL